MDPQQLINNLGDVAFWVVLGIIFAECGILLGFFLPGDSLLFITGLCIASGIISMNIWVAALLLIIAAVVGNITGYWIGHKAGPTLFKKEDSKLFRKEYVDKTHAFFEKYGWLEINDVLVEADGSITVNVSTPVVDQAGDN